MSNRIIALLVILLFGIVGTAISSPGRPSIETIVVPPSSTLTASERASVTHVYPRIMALNDEVIAVRDLVDEQSRNLFSLAAHGNRIRTIVDQIGTAPGIDALGPELSSLHGRTTALGETLVGILESAEGAMERFDFTSIPGLVSRFDAASIETCAILQSYAAIVRLGDPGTLNNVIATPR